MKKPEGGSERSHRAGSPPGGAGPPLAALAYGEATLAHFCHRPFAYIVVPENLSEGGCNIPKFSKFWNVKKINKSE
jgi:hypothetical protein